MRQITLIGIYHNVSREYLHRYLWQFDFLWNNRQLNDGERTILAVKAAEGKRLMYKDPVAEREYIKTREQKERAVNNSNHSKKKATPGPKAERLKLKGNWRDLVKKSLSKKKPAEGWPE
jgi:hypothetical protein